MVRVLREVRVLLEKREAHVVSCFAPTRSPRRANKDQFIMTFLSKEKYVLIGDYNACFGQENSGIRLEVMGQSVMLERIKRNQH